MEKIELNFSCPIELSQLEGYGKVKYCGQCSKNVTNFSNEKGKIKINKSDGELCGIFKPEQLYQPFGDFRDFFVRFYQKSVEKQKSSKFKYSIVFAVSSVLLFLTSCGNRRMAGGMVYYPEFEDEQETVDSTNTEIDKTNDNLILFEE